MAPGDWYSFFWLYFRDGNEGKKKRSAGQNMRVHTLLLLLLQFKLLEPCKRERFGSKYETYLFLNLLF